VPAIKTINHYTLSLNEVKDLKIPKNFVHKIFTSFSDLDTTILNKITNTFGNDKVTEIKFRFVARHKMVVTFIDNEFASYCFIGDAPFKFSFFELKEKELYFYDCFTFENFRGRNALYSEVKYAIDIYKERGYTYAHVEIEDTNLPSKKAFEKVGFQKKRTFYHFTLLGIGITFSSGKCSFLKVKTGLSR